MGTVGNKEVGGAAGAGHDHVEQPRGVRERLALRTLIGTEDMVRERLRVWRDAGVDTVRFYPARETLDARVATLGRAIELVRDIEDEAVR